MLESIGGFLGSISLYITLLLGLIALYFCWVAFREWRTRARAMFGVERDIAASEMTGAISRAGVLIFVGLLIFGLGQAGRSIESDDETAQSTRSPLQTAQVVKTVTPNPGEPTPPSLPTDTPQPMLTGVPPLPEVPTETSSIEPTPRTATVTVYGGVWLRDAPNGGPIVVIPQFAVLEMLEGQESAGGYEWQEVRILNVPPGDAQVDQEGWVALQFLEVQE